MTDAQRFTSIVRARSKENRSAIRLLYSNGLIGQVISVLRQEVDSMVRVIYLLNKKDLSERYALLRQTLKGEKWKIEKHTITDREMVDLANKLLGWTQSVYKFGCGFIHLSVLHDYSNDDPFQRMESQEIQDIKHHLNHYHDFPLTQELTLMSLKRFLPSVFEKIADNLEYYLQHLEKDEIEDVL